MTRLVQVDSLLVSLPSGESRIKNVSASLPGGGGAVSWRPWVLGWGRGSLGDHD